MTSTTPTLRRQPGLELDPNVTVLVRRNGCVQIGWDPESALLLTPPDGIGTDVVLAMLRLLDGKHSRPQVVWRAAENGITPADMSAILSELGDAGVLRTIDALPEPRARSIRIHGRGPLSDAIAAGLSRGGLRVSRSGSIGVELDISRWRVDFVVLADDMVADPRLATDLVAARIPHLQVRIRDGKGIVGPMVLPGSTSCLRCADLTRCDFDPEWPHIAAQMLGRVGRAGPAAVMATTAVALGQLETVLTGPPRRPPASLDATLELDLETHRLRTRSWQRHPLCGCAEAAGS